MRLIPLRVSQVGEARNLVRFPTSENRRLFGRCETSAISDIGLVSNKQLLKVLKASVLRCRLEVDWTIGRDLTSDDMNYISDTLLTW